MEDVIGGVKVPKTRITSIVADYHSDMAIRAAQFEAALEVAILENQRLREEIRLLQTDEEGAEAEVAEVLADDDGG